MMTAKEYAEYQAETHAAIGYEDCDDDFLRAMQMTDEEIEEELRQLRELEDGEEFAHPDTQFSDYPE